MKLILFLCIFVALAFAKPSNVHYTTLKQVPVREPIRILRDHRVYGSDGSFDINVESEDGIYRSESGRRLTHVENSPIGSQGVVRFTFPNGEKFFMKYVANENGFYPESSHLPVAPVFPHPIPQFVVDQIEKAAREDAKEEEEARRRAKILLKENKNNFFDIRLGQKQ